MAFAKMKTHKFMTLVTPGALCLRSFGSRPLDPWAEKWENELKHNQVFQDVATVDVTKTTEKSEGTIRLVLISDTHNEPSLENPINIPDGDVLLHTGDFTNKGELREIKQFAEWFHSLPHKHKICIAGNHDLGLDLKGLKGEEAPQAIAVMRNNEYNFTYLENELHEVMGLRIYGSPNGPYTPFAGFHKFRGKDLQAVWDKIPDGVDILMVHPPPLGRGDAVYGGNRLGDEDLLHAIQQRVKPRICVFGHNHGGHGISSDGTTIFANAAWEKVQQAIVLDIPLPKTEQTQEDASK